MRRRAKAADHRRLHNRRPAVSVPTSTPPPGNVGEVRAAPNTDRARLGQGNEQRQNSPLGATERAQSAPLASASGGRRDATPHTPDLPDLATAVPSEWLTDSALGAVRQAGDDRAAT